MPMEELLDIIGHYLIVMLRGMGRVAMISKVLAKYQ
jgi:hypothetical protein